jgi:hypothetical protein
MAHEFFHCIEHLPLIHARSSQVALARSTSYVSLSRAAMRLPWYDRVTAPRKLSTSEDWREWQANQFAAELLMPAASVVAAFVELFGVTQLPAHGVAKAVFADQTARAHAADDWGGVSSLVDRFDINPQAMAIRLMDLGLVAEAPPK